MERDKPAAADLLETARALLRDELIEHLPASQKLNGLMIANAMAIAARELGQAPALEGEAEAQLRLIYAETEDVGLVTLTRRISRDIREGRFDNDEAVYRSLLENTRKRIAISNPRYLAASQE
ncbi:MAG: DUF6285 domain-containing protein [Proteobacteria bacterium]|nr:DUF6285 domain-containing protein [Pseudomonadota bacterium]